ncbi:uncharacterized protein LOC126838573 [Adelges cooleyi]|uniref:uncharacterized protein LOC126838573 n=1 Tax=Adelges cooleyi TaxID=133065 RepID=UPI00217FA8BD|nr:uncharacterized protein LOC126838573 [Adelges cooleyi]
MICYISTLLVLVGSVSIGSDLINVNASLSHCVFSTYMLHFFELNELYFLDHHLKGNREVYTLDDLKKNYASILHYQNDIIMAMLDDIRTRNRKAYATDLMTVNLFLNNRTGNVLNLYHSSDASGGHRDYNDEDASKNCRQGLLNHYKMITGCLRQHVWSACSVEFILNFYDVPYSKLTVNRKKWTEIKRDKSTVSVKLANMMGMVNYANRALQRILGTASKNYKDFHPENMLFSQLFEAHNERQHPTTSTQSNITGQANDVDGITVVEKENIPLNTGDGLSMMKKVIVDSSKCNDDKKYTIVDLYDQAVLNFNANHIKSFQQQVFAASVHPIFACISTYSSAIKRIILENKNVSRYDDKLKSLGQSFSKSLKRFNHESMYPYKVSEYIKKVIKQFNDIVKKITDGGTPKVANNKVSNLVHKCSRPMILNRLKFNTQENIKKTESIADNNHEALLLTCEEEIKETHNYIQSLKKFKHVFEIVKRSVYHSNMFRKRPFDVISKTCKSDIRKKPVSTTSTTV